MLSEPDTFGIILFCHSLSFPDDEPESQSDEGCTQHGPEVEWFAKECLDDGDNSDSEQIGERCGNWS